MQHLNLYDGRRLKICHAQHASLQDACVDVTNTEHSHNVPEEAVSLGSRSTECVGSAPLLTSIAFTWSYFLTLQRRSEPQCKGAGGQRLIMVTISIIFGLLLVLAVVGFTALVEV